MVICWNNCYRYVAKLYLFIIRHESRFTKWLLSIFWGNRCIQVDYIICLIIYHIVMKTDKPCNGINNCTGTTIINGFWACRKCEAIFLYECKFCYALTTTKGEHHSCPNLDNKEDEGIVEDLGYQSLNSELKNFKERLHYRCVVIYDE